MTMTGSSGAATTLLGIILRSAAVGTGQVLGVGTAAVVVVTKEDVDERTLEMSVLRLLLLLYRRGCSVLLLLVGGV